MKQTILFLFVMVLAFSACHDVKIGYLKADNAEYYPDSLVVETDLSKVSQNKVDNDAPWVTNTISGMLGTEPLSYEFVSVRAIDGGDADIFAKEIVVRGSGRMQFPLRTEAPKGRYIVTLKVSNEDYSVILPDVFTFILK